MDQQRIECHARQITQGPQQHLFGYTGMGGHSPWSCNGRFILSLQVDGTERMPEPGEAARVALIDTHQKYKVQVVDRTLAWNLQQGTMLHWNPDAPDTQFFFNDLDAETFDVFAVLYDIEMKQRVKEFRFDTSIGLFDVPNQGGYFLGINFGRMSRMRKVVRYAGAHDWSQQGTFLDQDGLWKVDIKTGRANLFLSFRQLLQVRPSDWESAWPGVKDEDIDTYLHQIIVSPDDRWIYLTLWGHVTADVDGQPVNLIKKRRVAYVIRTDGRDLRVLPTYKHPEWTHDQQIITSDPGMPLYDVKQQRLTEPLDPDRAFKEPNNDKAVSPDGAWLVGSEYAPDQAGAIYTFMRLADKRIGRSGIIPGVTGLGKDVRVDPAPRWNRDSNAILVPSRVGDGTRQLFVIDLRKVE